jgi:hypothetical protein
MTCGEHRDRASGFPKCPRYWQSRFKHQETRLEVMCMTLASFRSSIWIFRRGLVFVTLWFVHQRPQLWMRRVFIGASNRCRGPWLRERRFPFFKLQASPLLKQMCRMGQVFAHKVLQDSCPLGLRIIFARDMSNFESEILLLASIRQHLSGVCT